MNKFAGGLEQSEIRCHSEGCKLSAKFYLTALQTKEAIALKQRNEQVQADLQEALDNKKQEIHLLLDEKAAALEQMVQLKQQLKDGQVTCAAHAMHAVHACMITGNR